MIQRFRASIYVDVFINLPNGILRSPAAIEVARELAEKQIRYYQNNIANSYIGGVACMNGLKLDKEI